MHADLGSWSSYDHIRYFFQFANSREIFSWTTNIFDYSRYMGHMDEKQAARVRSYFSRSRLTFGPIRLRLIERLKER